MSNLYESFSQGRERGAERRTRRTLGEYMQPALGGDQAAQQAIYGVDPDAGFKVQQMAQQQAQQGNKAAQDDFSQFSRLYASASETMRQQMYSGWRARAIKAGLPAEMPEAYDPQSVQVAQAVSGTGKEEPRIVAPGSALVGNDGKLIYERPFAPAKPEYQLYEGADGPAWLPKPTGAPQGQGSAPAGQGSFGIAETDGYVRNILGKAGQLDPNAPAEQVVAQLLPHVIQQESGGNPNAVSPKGARGLMQVMPATAQDPGFGVRPLQGNSPEENVRFGRDYLTAMVNRYPGRPDLALAAYNAGPGVADKFRSPLASNGTSAIPIGGVRPKSKGVRRMSADEVQQAGFRPGSIVEVNEATGESRVVQAPADTKDASTGKPLPLGAVNSLTKDAGKLANLQDLTPRFQDSFAGNTITGSAENMMGRLGIPGATEGQADWWQQYDRYKNEVRNELFGASLTSGEQAAFKAADVEADMAPARVRANLAKQAEIIQKALQRKAKVWAAQGYNRAAIEEATGVQLGGDGAKSSAPSIDALLDKWK